MSLTSLFELPIFFWITLAALLVLIPILIHLIQLFRYRRVRWAAMEFLLAGHRRKKRKIWMSQILLIGCRIALLMICLLLFAEVGCRSDESNHRVPGRVHHLFLDDSFSMGERTEGIGENQQRQTCFEQAKMAVLELATTLEESPDQTIVIHRLSPTNDPIRLEDRTFRCDSAGLFRLKQSLEKLVPSDQSFEVVGRLNELLKPMNDLDGEKNMIYLLSDFRQRDWDPSQTLPEALGSPVRLVHCGSPGKQINNLAIQQLQPTNGILTANVPFFIELSVTNVGDADRTRIPVDVRIAEIGDKESESWEPRELPSLFLQKIDKGETAVERFPVLIREPGWHLIEARLPEDDLAVDNVIQLAVHVESSSQILLINQAARPESDFIQWAFHPREQSAGFTTGYGVDLKSSQQVADFSSDELANYQAIFLLSDLLRVTGSQTEILQSAGSTGEFRLIRKLEHYVAEGGVLFIIPGDYVDIPLVNQQLYRSGSGLMPFPIETALELSTRPENIDSDISIVDSRLSRFFAGDNRELLNRVFVRQKYVPPASWQVEDEQQTQILATVRGRSTTPLIGRRLYGEGVAITFLCPVSTRWSNWPKNPTFVVLMHQLLLENARYQSDTEKPVGFRLEWGEEAREQKVDIRFRAQTDRGMTTKSLTVGTPDRGENETPVGGSNYRFDRRGWYQVDEAGSVNHWVTRLDPAESKLQQVDFERWKNDDRMVGSSELSSIAVSPPANGQILFFMLLLALFLLEPLLAWRQSYQHLRKEVA